MRDREFSQKTKEALLQIEKKLDVKNEKFHLMRKERNIEQRVEEQKNKFDEGPSLYEKKEPSNGIRTRKHGV